MNDLKLELILKAKQIYNQIYPCGNRSTLYDCFTVNDNFLVFWFNTKDKSTHMLKISLNDVLVNY